MFQPRATLAYRLSSRRARRSRLLGTGSENSGQSQASGTANHSNQSTSLLVVNRNQYQEMGTQLNISQSNMSLKSSPQKQSGILHSQNVGTSGSMDMATGKEKQSKPLSSVDNISKGTKSFRKTTHSLPNQTVNNHKKVKEKIKSLSRENQKRNGKQSSNSIHHSNDDSISLQNMDFARSTSVRERSSRINESSVRRFVRSKSFRESRSPKLGRMNKTSVKSVANDRNLTGHTTISMMSMRTATKDSIKPYFGLLNFKDALDGVSKNNNISVSRRSFKKYSQQNTTNRNSAELDVTASSVSLMRSRRLLSNSSNLFNSDNEMSSMGTFKGSNTKLPTELLTKSEVSAAALRHATKNVQLNDFQTLSDTDSISFRGFRDTRRRDLSLPTLIMSPKITKNNRGILKFSARRLFSRSLLTNVTQDRTTDNNLNAGGKSTKVDFTLASPLSSQVNLKQVPGVLSSTSLIAAVENVRIYSKVNEDSPMASDVIEVRASNASPKNTNAQNSGEGVSSESAAGELLPTYQYGATLPEKYQPLWPRATKDC